MPTLTNFWGKLAYDKDAFDSMLEDLDTSWGKFAAAADMYIAPDERKNIINPPGTDITALKKTVERGGKAYYTLLAFVGRQSKPIINSAYSSENFRDRMLEDLIKTRKEMFKGKQEQKEFAHNIKEGDIFYSSWGYDQTNIDFYQVIRIVGKSIEIRKLQKNTRSGGGPSDYVTPLPGRFESGEPVLKKIPQKSGDSVNLKINSYAWAHPWDGKAMYQTNTMYGH
jgi:hypothetical protein